MEWRSLFNLFPEGVLLVKLFLGVSFLLLTIFTPLDNSLELRKADNVGVLRNSSTFISFTLSAISEDANVGHLREEEAIRQAREGLDKMNIAPSALGKAQLVSLIGRDALDSARSFEDIWGSVLGKLESFTAILDHLSAVRPIDQTFPNLKR